MRRNESGGPSILKVTPLDDGRFELFFTNGLKLRISAEEAKKAATDPQAAAALLERAS